MQEDLEEADNRSRCSRQSKTSNYTSTLNKYTPNKYTPNKNNVKSARDVNNNTNKLGLPPTGKNCSSLNVNFVNSKNTVSSINITSPDPANKKKGTDVERILNSAIDYTPSTNKPNTEKGLLSTPYCKTVKPYNVGNNNNINNTAPAKQNNMNNANDDSSYVKGFACNDDFVSIDKSPFSAVAHNMSDDENCSKSKQNRCLFYAGAFKRGYIDGPVKFFRISDEEDPLFIGTMSEGM